MNARERKVLGEYIRSVADAMELRDWTLELSHGPPDLEDSFAEVTPTDGRKIAVIAFCEEFRRLEPTKQRMIVVHELVHCHTAMVQHQVERDLEKHLGLPVDRIFFHSFRRNLEYAVDGLTHALAKHLPLIEWPK